MDIGLSKASPWTSDMRIIAGKFKGRVVEMPKGIRPTSDKVREALFEILKDRIEGASFLDLYCGSGAIGIEAISRGAKAVTFVDSTPKCISALKRNLRQLDIIADIYIKDVLKIFEGFSAEKACFDIVFLDPPYYKDMAKNTLIAISDYDILARNAIIAVETYKKDELPEEAGLLRRFRVSRYGDTKLELYKK